MLPLRRCVYFGGDASVALRRAAHEGASQGTSDMLHRVYAVENFVYAVISRSMTTSILAYAAEALSERYLGLPTVVGKSKDGCFQYITERSGRRYLVEGSGAVKERQGNTCELVLQATLTYPMSCFKFNKRQCKKLSSIASDFWWGDADGSR
jgi:hypothetical protein